MRLRDWQTHSWCLLAIYLALAMIVVVALPTTPDIVPESDPNVNEGQPAEEFSVDVDRFAHLLSNHFLFDHLEYAFYLLSKRVSVQFRDSINVDVRLLSSPESEPFNPSVDINILKGQLEGAVGCKLFLFPFALAYFLLSNRLVLCVKHSLKISSLQCGANTQRV